MRSLGRQAGMQGIITGLRFAVVLPACLALALLATAVSLAQTPPDAPHEAKTSDDPAGETAGHGPQLQADDDLYILKDLPEPAPDQPKLDLGKVGKKGSLSLERMPLESAGEYDTRPPGAGGIRLKFPLGKQAP